MRLMMGGSGTRHSRCTQGASELGQRYQDALDQGCNWIFPACFLNPFLVRTPQASGPSLSHSQRASRASLPLPLFLSFTMFVAAAPFPVLPTPIFVSFHLYDYERCARCGRVCVCPLSRVHSSLSSSLPQVWPAPDAPTCLVTPHSRP